MEASQAAGIDRRNFLKLAATLPLLGALGAIVSPLLRFLKPNIQPFRVYAPTAHDVPKGEQIIAATGVLMLSIFLGVGVTYARGVRPPSAAQSIPAPDTAVPRSLAMDPRDGSLIKATSRGLFRSVDGGRRWKPLLVPSPLAQFGIGQVVVKPETPTLIYAAGVNTGVILSEDGGSTWRRITNGLPSLEVEALAIHAFRRETLFASIRGRGVYRTENGGQQWQRMDGGPAGKPVIALSHSPLPGSMNTGWLYAGTVDGPYLSMDCF